MSQPLTWADQAISSSPFLTGNSSESHRYPKTDVFGTHPVPGHTEKSCLVKNVKKKKNRYPHCRKKKMMRHTIVDFTVEKKKGANTVGTAETSPSRSPSTFPIGHMQWRTR